MSIGDSVYFRVLGRQGKLDRKWRRYYRIVGQTSLITFVRGDQLTRKTKRVHVDDLKLTGSGKPYGSKTEKGNFGCRR